MKKLNLAFWGASPRESTSILAFICLFALGLGTFYLLGRLSPQKELDYVLKVYPPLPPPERFSFNPNTLPLDSLYRLGISEKLGKTIDNYRSKGGKFRKKEDLKAIYGFPPALYDSLEAYVILPPIPTQKATPLVVSVPQLDINLADSTDLMGLRGIGRVFSQRILKYRTALGGFYSINQLAEVYGMKAEMLAIIKPQLKIQHAHTKIPINTVETLKHPYLHSYQAKAILNFRQQHGAFKGVEDLKAIEVLDEETLAKLRPYLQF
jgi:competence protein ComEA